jgi:hypothetical protein
LGGRRQRLVYRKLGQQDIGSPGIRRRLRPVAGFSFNMTPV